MTNTISAAGSCLQPLCDCLNGTGMLGTAAQEVSSFLRLKSNWGDLDKAKELLLAVETTVRRRVTAEMDKLNVCDPQVQVWLRHVDELQLEDIDDEYGQLMQYSCLCQCTLHAHRRTLVGRRVVEALDEVNKLIEEGRRFRKFGFKPLPKIVDPLPLIKTFRLETMLSQLHNLFEKGDSNIIGVWGQEGVGKTTLLHAFSNYLDKKVHDYQVFIFIEVSNSETLNTVEIQQTISERLKLPWNEAEPVAKRARFLVEVLARKRFVVLLDDVRRKFRLEDVGIPTPDTNSQSKLILTSRYRQVCIQMNTQRSLIEMQILDRDASWELFLSKLSKEARAAVEAVGSQNVIREYAMAIAQSCGGLPLALDVIGTAVAGLEEREWKYAADAIATNMHNIDGVDEMFGRLKYSFDRLTPTQQQCFLYCTLFPEYGSISKAQLVDYWLAEGFLLNDHEKGYQIIRSLISACLLQTRGSLSSKVKMHHMIRHLGLWLVNKSDTKFLAQPGMALDYAPSAEEWKEATRISIMSNNITELSFSPRCKNITTLLIQNNPNLNKMSYGFFRTMSSLKVLDLSHTAITSLPECDTLVALEHLNLSHTHIMRLPEHLWLLKELRHLDLSVTDALEDTLNNCSKLHNLRVLNLFRSHYGFRDLDDLNLDSLKELLFLGITIYAEDVLKKLNKPRPFAKSIHRLNLKYCAEMQSIKISDLNHMEHLEELYVESCYDLNTVIADAELTTSHLQFLTLSVLPSLENVLVAPVPHNFQYIRKLVISQCPKLLNITWVRKLRMLVRLVISHCDGMLEIVEDGEQCGAQMEMQEHTSHKQDHHTVVKTSWNDKGHNDFPKLRSIVLTELKKLRSICRQGTFPCLEILRVEDCPNLRSIPPLRFSYMNDLYISPGCKNPVTLQLQHNPNFVRLCPTFFEFMHSFRGQDFFKISNVGIDTFSNEIKEWGSDDQMDREVNAKLTTLENMLLDGSAEPTDLPLSLLEDITNCFSDEQQIGIGGFAVVYKGMVGNRIVAVKRLSRTFDMQENKFHKEIECLMKAKHKNIVRFLGYCSDTQGKIADYEGKFVMADVRNWLLCFEYAPNGSLDKYISDASRGLTWEERYQIIKGICDGLCHLHEKRILHLDLKPANILVDDHMVPKITDFGVSRCLDAEQTRVFTSNLCGSQGYLPPEFYRGEIAFSSDIYSLGVIILEILTGKKRYSEDENVVQSWMNRLEVSDEREMQLKQIRVCTKIGIECMDSDPKRRPVVRHIVDILDKVANPDYLHETAIHSSPDDVEL